MAFRLIYIGLVSAIFLPAAARADEAAAESGGGSETYYSGIEDLSLRRDITGIGHYYILQPGNPASAGDDIAAQRLDRDATGGSAGGYVNFGSPSTSSFLGPVPQDTESSWMDGVEFGVDWRPDVSGAANQDYRRITRSFSGSEIDRVGVRADLTALLRDEPEGGDAYSAWRVTGMLGSTSLSLFSDDDNISSSMDRGAEGGGLLWDVGVGWSSGAMSVNAGYQSAYSLGETSEEGSAVTILSLGADYAVMPGLSVYGEFNVIDSPLDDSQEGLGTVVIIGTGVSF